MVAHSRTPLRPDRLRALNLPSLAVVELDERGLPTVVMAEDGGERRKVEMIGEIWHVDDEWWRTPINRRYVEVILEGGKHVMLFEDLVTNVWFVQMP